MGTTTTRRPGSRTSGCRPRCLPRLAPRRESPAPGRGMGNPRHTAPRLSSGRLRRSVRSGQRLEERTLLRGRPPFAAAANSTGSDLLARPAGCLGALRGRGGWGLQEQLRRRQLDVVARRIAHRTVKATHGRDPDMAQLVSGFRANVSPAPRVSLVRIARWSRLSQSVSWIEPGHDLQGVQGRYFLPIAPATALLLQPRSLAGRRSLAGVGPWLAALMATLFAIVSLAVIDRCYR
jgi:hypothetical protein